MEEETYETIRRELPYIKIVQVVNVSDESALKTAWRLDPLVDALLLHSGRTDRTEVDDEIDGPYRDWDLSREIVRTVAAPVFLSGGLGPGNIIDAIRAVHPFGVDVSGSIRTGRNLDTAKLKGLILAMEAL